MSCQACDLAQMPAPTPTGLDLATYVRVGNSSLLISGCMEHMSELINKLRQSSEVPDGSL